MTSIKQYQIPQEFLTKDNEIITKQIKLHHPELNDDEWDCVNETIQKKVLHINKKYHKSIKFQYSNEFEKFVMYTRSIKTIGKEIY